MGGNVSEVGEWSNWLTAASVLIAAAGMMFNARLQRSLSKKQHTIGTILSVHFNETYSKSLEEIRVYLEKPEIDIRDDDIIHIRTILNFYEFLSAALHNGDLDENILVDMRGTTLIRFYERFNKYIKDRRISLERPKLYEHIEWFYMRNRVNLPSRIQRVLEWVRARPSYGVRTPI